MNKRMPVLAVGAMVAMCICTGCPDMMMTMGMMDDEAIPRLFGDGSAGAKVITEDTVLREKNMQFTDFTVESGVTVTIASGTVIRVQGQFTNNGTIMVANGAEGASRTGFDTTTLDGSSRPADAGLSSRAAGNGEIGTAAAQRSSGIAGDGLSEFESRTLLRAVVKSGGGGGAARGEGGDGGGGLTVIAFKEISNNGMIMADGGAGADGGGGGAGGLVVLASRTSVTNAHLAMISSSGGSGGTATTGEGPGGGGGGGVVHAIAPVIVNAGEVRVVGGTAGTMPDDMKIGATVRSGGGGGGAMGGKGGNGGSIAPGADVTPGEAENGTDGFWLQTEADPTSLL